MVLFVAEEIIAGHLDFILKIKPKDKEDHKFVQFLGKVKAPVDKLAKMTNKVKGILKPFAIVLTLLGLSSGLRMVVTAFYEVVSAIADLFTYALTPVWKPLLMGFVEWAGKFATLFQGATWQSMVKGIKKSASDAWNEYFPRMLEAIEEGFDSRSVGETLFKSGAIPKSTYVGAI